MAGEEHGPLFHRPEHGTSPGPVTFAFTVPEALCVWGGFRADSCGPCGQSLTMPCRTTAEGGSYSAEATTGGVSNPWPGARKWILGPISPVLSGDGFIFESATLEGIISGAAAFMSELDRRNGPGGDPGGPYVFSEAPGTPAGQKAGQERGKNHSESGKALRDVTNLLK